MSPSKILSLEQIQACTTLNGKVVEQALDQAEKRLEDALATKGAFETKATALLTCWLTVALALFGAGGIIGQANAAIAAPYWVAGVVFSVASIFFVVALWDARYGVLGGDPKDWLNTGILVGDDSVVDRMGATLVYFYVERIAAANNANVTKATAIRLGIVIGAMGPFAFLVSEMFKS